MPPHATTKIAPCELLYNRTVKGHLPELPSKKVLNKHKEAEENIEKSKHGNKKAMTKDTMQKNLTLRKEMLLFVYRRNEIS